MDNVLRNRIKELMVEKKITQAELANALGITQATLSRNLSGVHRPKAEVVEGIASFFDVSSDYLLGNTDIRKNPARNTSVDPNDVSFALHSTIDKLSEADKKFILQMAKRMLDPNDSHH